MADFTLQRMAAGGMYDHVGGGYARYGVDAKWLVPHFEKMLYDNALLARAYLHAWQATDDPEHRRIPRGMRCQDLRSFRARGATAARKAKGCQYCPVIAYGIPYRHLSRGPGFP
jgi:hypothetical protein